MHKVTVIINVLNGEKFIEKAIHSIINQTYQNICILIFDNNSSDNTYFLVNSFKDIELEYFKSDKTLSLGNARNRALQMVKTNFCCFLDCDDTLIKDSIEKRLNKILSGDYIFCICGHYNVKANKTISKYIPANKDGLDFGFLLMESGIMPSGLMLNMTKVKKYEIKFDEHLHVSEEVCFALELAQVGEFCSVKEPLFNYLIHDNSLSSKNKHIFSLERKYIINKIIKKDPNIKNKFPKQFLLSESKIHYYDACYLMDIKEYNKARVKLYKLYPISILYKCLYFVSFIPTLWNVLHSSYIKLSLQKISLKIFKSYI